MLCIIIAIVAAMLGIALGATVLALLSANRNCAIEEANAEMLAALRLAHTEGASK